MCTWTLRATLLTMEITQVHQPKKHSVHTQERPSARKRREALTFATMWTDPENTMLRKEADTEGHTGCDSTDGKRPEQAD